MNTENLIRFRDEADNIYEQAQAYRRQSPSARLLTILDLVAFGEAMMKQSPQREASQRLREAEEERWRTIQKELFARHVR